MDKNAIKKFAVWARTELIARVSLKGVEYGITEGNIEDANVDSVGGKVLTADEKKQRQALIAEINDKGYKQVMEEVAYTWFNRFSALRFMEVNGYIPSHVRVFTDEENNFKPQIITEAIHLDLDGLDMEKVYELKDAEKTEELYKYLLIVQCNALNKILPGMFQRLSDYTELLLPDNLLREGSVIQKMIELIPEDDWKDELEKFLKEITFGIEIRAQEKIFENAESIHRLMAEQEKMDSAILAFELLVLCIKEKMSTVSMKWIVDTSGYPDVETRIGKDYFDSIRDYAKHIRQYPKKVNYKFVCKENDFVDKMIFIISGLYNEYKNNECDSFYCADKEIQQKLNFSKKVYELLKI